MRGRLRDRLPEALIAAAMLFFAYRELGTFPGAWLDEGLFIMTARNVADGAGYAIDLLDAFWFYPYFLAVGPTVILPVALSLKIFGLSVAAARLPMTLYLLGTAVASYALARKIAGVAAARWSTALLVSLSAFVNTGKPVLGEVPAYFFLLLGMLALLREGRPWRRGALAGVFFGLSILSKLTFGIVLPALFAAWCVAAWQKRRKDVEALTIAGVLAVAIYLPWRLLEAAHTPAGSLTDEIGRFVFGGGDTPVLFVLRETPELLLRLPFLAFSVFLVLGAVGLRETRMRTDAKIVAAVAIALFTAYFLNSYGWYRHLLPAHLLLLPFVPAGAARLLGRRGSVVALSCVVALQGLWQLQHRGAGQGTALAETVRVVKEEYADTNLLIEQAEVFAQLPRNPRWVYRIRDRVSPTMPERFMTPTGEMRCWPRLTKLNDEELRAYGESATKVGNVHVVPPPADCR